MLENRIFEFEVKEELNLFIMIRFELRLWEFVVEELFRLRLWRRGV